MSRLPVWRVALRHVGQALAEALSRSFLITFTAVYLLGQVSATWGWDIWSPVWLIGCTLVLIVVWFCGSFKFLAFCVSLLCAFSLANAALQRVLTPQLPPTHLRHLSLPQQVTLEGWLFREPERFPTRGRLYLEAVRIWHNGRPRAATGKILVTVRFLSGPWQYGDLLRLSVRLRAPRNFRTPGSFDYEGYLARQGIYLSAFLWDDTTIVRTGASGHRMRRWLEHARRTIGTFFDHHLDSQTAAILRALIIGDDGRLGKDVRETFARAGVAHVLSISGLHIGLVAAAAYGAWWWLLGRSRYLLLRFTMPKLAAVLTIPPVLLYAGLAGGSVATWRATIMVLVYLLAILLNRQDEVYRSLALAALLISLLWPGAVLDISFQLSFLSMLAIFLGMSRFSVWWAQVRQSPWCQLHPRWARLLHWGVIYIAVSGCALLGTAPATAAHFNQVALAGLFANVLVVPLLGSAAVLLGLAAACAVFLLPGVASLFLLGAGLITRLGAWLVEGIGTWPYAAVRVVTPTLLELVLLYGLLTYTLCHSTLRQWHAGTRFLLPLLVAALLTDSALWTWDRYFRRDLRVTFLDVGQGDAAVVEFPGSPVMVIDGGGFASEDFDTGQAIVAPFLWSRKIGRIDILVLSHPQLDHYGGLAFLVQHFSVREFWFNGDRAPSERFARLQAALDRAGVVSRVLCRGAADQQFAGVRVQILHPPCQRTGRNTNNASLIVRLSHGTVDFLFTGDVEAPGEHTLLAATDTVASEILKVPHHGSRTSSTWAFVRAVAPQVAVVSLGLHNRFHFPAPEVVHRYTEHGGRLLRTDQVGAVTVLSTGQTYRVETVVPFR